MCIHLSREIWERNKDRLLAVAETGDRKEAMRIVKSLHREEGYRGVRAKDKVYYGTTDRMISDLLATARARDAHERERELVPA